MSEPTNDTHDGNNKDQDGREEAGREEAGREEAGRDEDGREEAGRDGNGNDHDVEQLEELRAEIREIDHDIVELIARRTYVADTIAQVKSEQGLPTTDEQQEDRVMERAGQNAERFEVDSNLVKAIFRLLIELNKVEQRENR